MRAALRDERVAARTKRWVSVPGAAAADAADACEAACAAARAAARAARARGRAGARRRAARARAGALAGKVARFAAGQGIYLAADPGGVR